MQAQHLGDMTLRKPRKFARFLEAFGDQRALGSFGFAHAAAASASSSLFNSSQTKIAASSMERGSFVVSSTNMFTSFGMALPISVARMVVATAHTLLSNLRMLSTGLSAP